jgi:hypothetical protein
MIGIRSHDSRMVLGDFGRRLEEVAENKDIETE